MLRIKSMKIVLALLAGLFFAAQLCGDGFIVIPGPHPQPTPQPFPLEVKYHRVDVRIDDQAAVTSIDQVFVNPTPYRLEGYYLFPVPVNAVIKKFTMFVNDQELEAELLDAAKARQIYEDIVRRQRDPAILEYSGQGLLKARIFPIEPHSEKRIKITYQELLDKESQTVQYLYPLNTEKFSAKPLKDVAIRVEINSREKIKNIYCPTHGVEIVRKGETQAVIGYEEKEVKPDSDFKLYYSTQESGKLGFSLLTHRKTGEDGFFFLGLSPGFSGQKEEVVAKDIAFVLDVSGSMAGEKLDQAKKALLFCIENLNPTDRFEIIRFSTEAEALFGELTPFSDASRKQARAFVNDLRAIGGTNIDEALNLALARKGNPTRPYQVIFITDGKPTIGITEEEALVDKIKKANIGQTRIFTFGIGSEINTHLLDKITEITRASRSYIEPGEDIEVKVSDFYSRVQSPILTDVKLDFGRTVQVSRTYPGNLPDLFKGSTITLLGRYRGQGQAKVVLTGKFGDREQKIEFSADFSGPETKNDFIPPLWAARRIGFLLDQIRLHGQEKELIDEVTQLARTYGIITPYTSYLIVEDERDNTRRNVIRPQDQTLGQVAEGDMDFERRNREEYANMKLKGGAGSVQASKDVQTLNEAFNYAQSRPGQERLQYSDKKGQVQGLGQQIRNIQGRAVYNTGNLWVDSQIQLQKTRKSERIQAFTLRYFELLKKEPTAAPFLALGKNVSFILKDTLYEIYE